MFHFVRFLTFHQLTLMCAGFMMYSQTCNIIFRCFLLVYYHLKLNELCFVCCLWRWLFVSLSLSLYPALVFSQFAASVQEDCDSQMPPPKDRQTLCNVSVQTEVQCGRTVTLVTSTHTCTDTNRCVHQKYKCRWSWTEARRDLKISAEHCCINSRVLACDTFKK